MSLCDVLICSFDAYSEFSKNPRILTFTGSHCTLRRSDGAVITTRYEEVLHTRSNSHVLTPSFSTLPW